MPDGTDIIRRVKEVIVKALNLQVASEEIPDDESLFGGGMGLDSTATLEIIFAVEEEFGFEVDDDELRVELFDSVRTIAEYVGGKLRMNDAPPELRPGSLSDGSE